MLREHIAMASGLNGSVKLIKSYPPQKQELPPKRQELPPQANFAARDERLCGPSVDPPAGAEIWEPGGLEIKRSGSPLRAGAPKAAPGKVRKLVF